MKKMHLHISDCHLEMFRPEHLKEPYDYPEEYWIRFIKKNLSNKDYEFWHKENMRGCLDKYNAHRILEFHYTDIRERFLQGVLKHTEICETDIKNYKKSL